MTDTKQKQDHKDCPDCRAQIVVSSVLKTKNYVCQTKYRILEASPQPRACTMNMQQTRSVPASAGPFTRPLVVEQYPLLAAARVVSRYCLPEGELSDVTRLLDAFLDEFSCKWTLAESYKKTSSLRLMQYIAARQPATGMDPFYGRWVFNAATKLVVSCGDLMALQWLAESYLPDVFMTAAVEAAATTGYLNILEWLFDRHGDRCYWGGIEMCGALENSHAEVVEWLRTHSVPHGECVSMVLRSAAKAGNLSVVQWLCEEYNSDAEDAFVHAQRMCHWATARWLLANCELPIGKVNWNAAAEDGALAYLQFVHSRFPHDVPQRSPALPAAGNGHLDDLQWLHSELGVALTNWVMWLAAESGCLGYTPVYAAENGHLEVVKWLRKYRGEMDARLAIERAILQTRGALSPRRACGSSVQTIQ
ncbi:hypothetical protein BBJ28_00018241 [Nothophytophthora sp. Chile5]|nr:hypothetical protein BBJ28_00018241 [Nothophytophthora sp. Chile5]